MLGTIEELQTKLHKLNEEYRRIVEERERRRGDAVMWAAYTAKLEQIDSNISNAMLMLGLLCNN